MRIVHEKLDVISCEWICLWLYWLHGKIASQMNNNKQINKNELQPTPNISKGHVLWIVLRLI